MKKIKLVHVQLLPLLSGVQVIMLDLLGSLDRNKYEIYVISKPDINNSNNKQSLGIKSPLVTAVEGHGYNYIPVKSLRRNISPLDFIALIQLFLIFRHHKFDIVHTHSSKTGLLGRIAARLTGIKKVIHTVHGFPFHEHQSQTAQKIYRLLEKFAAKFCDKVVVVNQFERELAINSKLIPDYKIVTIYNGIKTLDKVEPKTYPINTKKKLKKINSLLSKTDKDLSLPQTPFIIGTVSRFTAAKNLINLTKIAIRSCRRNKELIFIFVGDGELYDECKDLVIKSGMEMRIIMPGWQTNIQEWLDTMDVFILYSLWEGLSMSILEAMASGLPIIASNIKGNNELVTINNGTLVDVKDHEGLQELLVSLPLRDKELSKWSKNSIVRVKENFSHTKFVENYLNLYENE